MSRSQRPHPYYDRWEPEPEEPDPGRRWLPLVLGAIVGACLLVSCAVGGYFILQPALQPILMPPTLPPPPAIPTLPGSNETATAAVLATGDPATPDPDATAAPAATVTLPSDAGGMNAVLRSDPPDIDGDLDDWPGDPTVSSSHLVYAYEGWDGSEDLGASWRLAWDQDRFYVAVEVTDDVHVQTQTGAFIYQGDSVELQVDINPESGATLVNPATSQIILSPGDFAGIAPSAARFRGTDEGELPQAPGHSIDVAARQTAGGYILEAAIPWSDLNVTPTAGMRLGLALNANDNDSPGVARQEVMLSNEPGRTLRNPSTWGTLILQSQ